MTFEELERLVLEIQADVLNLKNSVNQLSEKQNVTQTSLATLQTEFKNINHLGQLLDVKIKNIKEGDLLLYSDDGKWHNIQLSINTDGGSSATSLQQLSDVFLANLVDGQVLTYSAISKKWYNKTPESGGGGGGGDLSQYLTKKEAKETYFPYAGGTILGNVKVIKNVTADNVFAQNEVVAKA